MAVALRSTTGAGVVGFDIATHPTDEYTLGQLQLGIGVARWAAQEHAENGRVQISKLRESTNKGYYLCWKRPQPDAAGFPYRAQGAVLISGVILNFKADYRDQDGPFLHSILQAAQTAAFHSWVPTPAERKAAADGLRAMEKASRAYTENDFARAEKGFRKAVAGDPRSFHGHQLLAFSLFYQSKYSEAIPEYRRALELGRESGLASTDVERVLIDQLAMAYGLSGRHGEARALLEEASGKDPEYPMYYYILACTHAELGNLDQALANLTLAFARRAHMLEGETFPNPRSDESFRRFLGDERFEAAMKEMGF